MSFSDWLSTLGDVITSFIGWVTNCLNSLMSNYFILTIIGISLFFILFSFVKYLIYLFDVYVNGRVPKGANPDQYIDWVDKTGTFDHNFAKHHKNDYVSSDDLKVLLKDNPNLLKNKR